MLLNNILLCMYCNTIMFICKRQINNSIVEKTPIFTLWFVPKQFYQIALPRNKTVSVHSFMLFLNSIRNQHFGNIKRADIVPILLIWFSVFVFVCSNCKIHCEKFRWKQQEQTLAKLAACRRTFAEFQWLPVRLGFHSGSIAIARGIRRVATTRMWLNGKECK